MSGKREKTERLVGVISDTHGLVRPEAVEALRGVELILHAGDIGGPEVLESLGSVAPVVAVRGNNDKGEWAAAVPERETVMIGAVKIYMLHDLKEFDHDPLAEGCRVVVAGHSHKPLIEERGGVLYLNPGSAGPRRFKLPVSLAHLKIRGDQIQADLIRLTV